RTLPGSAGWSRTPFRAVPPLHAEGRPGPTSRAAAAKLRTRRRAGYPPPTWRSADDTRPGPGRPGQQAITGPRAASHTTVRPRRGTTAEIPVQRPGRGSGSDRADAGGDKQDSVRQGFRQSDPASDREPPRRPERRSRAARPRTTAPPRCAATAAGD